MWKCNCDENGKALEPLTSLREVSADVEGICTCCGYYAVWHEFKIMSDTPQVFSIFKLGIDAPPVYKKNAIEAFKYIGASKQTRISFLHSRREYTISKGHLLVMKKVTKLDGIYRQLVLPLIRAFNKQGELVAEALSVVEISKITEERPSVIRTNLHRQSFYSKKGLVYTRTDNFCLDTYLKNRSMEFSSKDRLVEKKEESDHFLDISEEIDYCNRYVK